VRLIKKEIGDKQSQSMKYLRQLLPFPKQMDEVKNRFLVPQNLNRDPLREFTMPPRKSASFYKYSPRNLC
jgi:hypothetical protein